MIQVGLNARLFPNNWRPFREEIAFGERHGFDCLQLFAKDVGITEAHLGDSFAVTNQRLRDADLFATLEVAVNVDPSGVTGAGFRPIQILHQNLPLIENLGIQHVHFHLVSKKLKETTRDEAETLEKLLLADLSEAVDLAAKTGFQMAFEHNAPGFGGLYDEPENCAAVLEQVPGLLFVWDFNHTRPDQIAAFKQLIPRMSHLHVSDAPLPEVNWHVPLGNGSVDYANYVLALIEGGFSGPAILEIGGIPWSGGYGQDTDAALIDSAEKLRTAIANACEAAQHKDRSPPSRG